MQRQAVLAAIPFDV